ncbi:hypothetical protein GOQ27_00045 [Clostridium sp. D2Q-11]|uniref:DUF2007 domain-containing protein n=1 Tax=Anaeromonas frigoriresistens TaxID=2683708 RepID=A0A942Z7G2_9FIRM|nr:hypothetical protein [Anaeromonas frigoriresistens]MBS4536829.1 hypothetical protein [Anaeromonas frigoriresistens]
MEDSVFLMKVSDDDAAEDVEELLRDNDIIVSRKYKDTEDYLQIYRAMTIYGVELYVNQKDLNKSKKLLNMNKNDIKNKIEKKTVTKNKIIKLVPFLNR